MIQEELNLIGKKSFKSYVSILDIKFAVLVHPILPSPAYFSQISETYWPKKDFPVYFDKK